MPSLLLYTWRGSVSVREIANGVLGRGGRMGVDIGGKVLSRIGLRLISSSEWWLAVVII